MAYVIGKALFDCERNVLCVDNKEKVLEHKLSLLLELFCRNPGVLLSKQSLLDEVWADRVVGEESLSVAISKLRRILDDSSRSPKYIKTVSGQGYIWIAKDTREVSAPGMANVQQTIKHKAVAQGYRGNRVIRRLNLLLIIGFVVLLLGVFTGFLLNQNENSVLSEGEVALVKQAKADIEVGSQASLKRAIVSLREILQLHPEYWDAYVGLAEAKIELSALKSFSDLQAYKSEINALLIYVLDNQPDHLRANQLLGLMHFLGDWNFEAAEQALDKAISLDAFHPDNYLIYNEVLISQGKFDRAEQYIKQLRSINPMYYQFPNMAYVYMMRGELALAMAEIERLERSEPSSVFITRMKHRLALLLGNEEMAFEQLELLMFRNGVDVEEVKLLAEKFSEGGIKAVFNHLYQERSYLNLGHYSPPLSWARYALLADRYDEALLHLKEAKKQMQSPVLLVNYDPLYLPLRKIEEYKTEFQVSLLE